MMNQSQSPTSPDSAPSLSKRRGQGNHRFPNARDRSRACRAHAADAVPYQKSSSAGLLIPLPAPYPRAPSLALRAIHLVAAQPPLPCKGEEGIAKSFYGTFGVYRGIESPLYSGNVSCQRGSARYDRWHRPQAATGAPRRRCASSPRDCPADGECPKRSSRNSPVRLPESASYR